MSNTAILVEAQRRVNDAVAKVNRIARQCMGTANAYVAKSANALAALDPNDFARHATDLVTAHAELLQANYELRDARNAS